MQFSLPVEIISSSPTATAFRAMISLRRTQAGQPGFFLSGGYIKLPPDVSAGIGIEEIKSGAATDPARLKASGWHPGKRALRLVRNRVVAALMDGMTPTRRTWNGHNSSTWRKAILEANGFDLDMGYGGLDRALGERLMNAGIRGRQVRHRTPCLHLYHERPYADPRAWKRNHEIRKRIRRNGETRAVNGIAELPHRRFGTHTKTGPASRGVVRERRGSALASRVLQLDGKCSFDGSEETANIVACGAESERAHSQARICRATASTR